jgi:hypothetical protein
VTSSAGNLEGRKGATMMLHDLWRDHAVVISYGVTMFLVNLTAWWIR